MIFIIVLLLENLFWGACQILVRAVVLISATCRCSLMAKRDDLYGQYDDERLVTCEGKTITPFPISICFIIPRVPPGQS